MSETEPVNLLIPAETVAFIEKQPFYQNLYTSIEDFLWEAVRNLEITSSLSVAAMLPSTQPELLKGWAAIP